LKQPKINITDILTDIIKQITIHSSFFSHIDINRLIVCLGSNKRNSRGAVFGKLVPFKFKDGNSILSYMGKFYTMPEIMNNGTAVLYAIYFYLPKFFDLSTEEKLNVIFHELYHISPEFNGDIRRMGEVKKAHGFSRKNFDKKFEKDVKLFHEYISKTTYMDFLKMDSRMLQKNYQLYARRMKIPRPFIVKAEPN
jgi:predicted metallopeptidase